MKRPRIAIESPYKATAQYTVADNELFARLCCIHALDQGANPFAMHLLYTQFLNDNNPEDRKVGIECGLGWTDMADEVWFCLREGERPTSGMLLAFERNIEVHRNRTARLMRFNDNGEFLREETLP